jgi:hypothetical protein
MNYATLADLIQSYAENDETTFVANIPNFVKLAEERIYRYVKIPNLRASTTLTAVIGDQNLTVPANFVKPDSLEVVISGVSTNLIPKDPDFLREAYPTAATTGVPLYYAVFDNDTIRVAPTPGVAYSFTLTYTAKPDSIVTAGTNWLGDNAEQALLYGSLVEAYTYMKGEPDLLALYEARFMEAVGQAKVVADGKLRTDDWRNSPPLEMR